MKTTTASVATMGRLKRKESGMYHAFRRPANITPSCRRKPAPRLRYATRSSGLLSHQNREILPGWSFVPLPPRAGESHMSILEVVELSPIFLLSRPPGWERVPDRAGEGSLSAKEMLLKSFSLSKKEPSPGLRPPSPIASQRERG